MLFDVDDGEAGLDKALADAVRRRPPRRCSDGASILILSDRGVDQEHAPIPSLLATAAVHHHLIREGTRTQAGLVIETGEAREVHHFCLLIGYGAGAINPYVAFETHRRHAPREACFRQDLTLDQAKKNYIKAANKGIIKVASKMGISTVQSYRGAQIFEAVGISKQVIDKYFTGTSSRINGVGLDVIARESLERHRHGYPADPRQRRSARQRRLLPVAPRRRIPHVEPRHRRQAPAGRPHHRLPDVQGIFQARQRRGPPPLHDPRPAELQEGHARSRSKKSSRPRRSSSGLSPARCRSARSARKPTRTSPSR